MDRPKRAKFTAAYYSKDEALQLLKCAKDEPCYIPVLLGVFYGMRRSEATGLQWSSVDFENNQIHIDHKAYVESLKGRAQVFITDVMKTDASKRTLPLIPQVREELLKHKARQEEYRRSFGRSYSKEWTDCVCVDPTGNILSPDFVTKHFGLLLTEHGLRHIRFHDLRHTCASLLVAQGVPMKQIQLWLGHSTYSTTADTVMSNHHLRNDELTLKAKGLLSQMLSLPENWDYTLKGLALINREQIDAIREAVRELERAGYIVRSRERDGKGRLRGADYIIYEQPQKQQPTAAPPVSDLPTLENPMLDNPTQEKPALENPTQENPTQLIKEEQITDLSSTQKINTDVLSTHSIPIPSRPLPSVREELRAARERNGTEKSDSAKKAFEIYRDIIKENIEYDILIQDPHTDREQLDEIVDLMLETICSARKTIRVAGDDYPAEIVKSKFLKLDSIHIQFVFDCLRENTTKIRNIKKYLLAVLFNAPSTINGYYTALVNHDMANGLLSPKADEPESR